MRSLDAHGYEMVPCGSEVFFFDDNFGLLVDYCERNLDRSRIPGYMIAPWLEMAPWANDRLVHAGETLGKVRRKLESS